METTVVEKMNKLSPQQIITLFEGKLAVTRLELDDASAWIIVQK